ncbi:MAG: proline--tRNA ligase [Nanoarchaeota archaeon]
MNKEKQGLTVSKQKDFSEWYTQIVQKAELADYAPIQGFMIIRPNAYSIWEKIQENFNKVLDKRNIPNSYFPLLIPESFFKKEAEHAKGFAPELAWIEKTTEEEKLAIRPTSETIMYDSYSKWIRSWRDLPFRLNQWCNVLRWEVSTTKPFIRTREFLWQEGHCVYETEKQCEKETLEILSEYEKICNDLLAIPTISGKKTDKEKFAGAKTTFTVESLMPDGKALQMGTSHNLGQDFAKAFNISYLSKDEKTLTPWQNSWGFSTRLIGALIMTHSDDKGLVLPPKVAKKKVVIIPILFEKTKKAVLKEAKKINSILQDSFLDDREEYTPGWKFNEYELQGIPIRIEIGPKDLAKKQTIVVRRDNNEKKSIKISNLKKEIPKILDDIQESLYKKAKKFLDSSIVEVKDMNSLIKTINQKKLAKTYFCGSEECEDWIKDKTKGATSRCSPLDQKPKKNRCVYCNKEANNYTYFSKSY